MGILKHVIGAQCTLYVMDTLTRGFYSILYNDSNVLANSMIIRLNEFLINSGVPQYIAKEIPGTALGIAAIATSLYAAVQLIPDEKEVNDNGKILNQ